jgi:hypothetical protein
MRSLMQSSLVFGRTLSCASSSPSATIVFAIGDVENDLAGRSCEQFLAEKFEVGSLLKESSQCEQLTSP